MMTLYYYQKLSVLLLPFVVILLLCSSSNGGQDEQYEISPIDLNALRDIKNSLTEIPTATTSEFFSTWDFTSPDPCSSFAGIICSSNPIRRVISLTLGTGLSDSPGLAGSLSPSISNLTELTQLVLFTGIVTGPIPPQLGANNLKNLRVISLTHNRLNGDIPASICSLPNLHTLDLSYNQLTGSVPACISRLAELKVLVLASNGLSGQLPPELPRGLLHLDLKTNGLSGMLPNEMPSSLRYLSASGNLLGGPLSALESLSELVYLDLGMNGFNGSIPPTLFRPSLTTMLLQRNNLSGDLPRAPHPPELHYGAGSVVDLSHNFLTGDLTDVLAGVETLFLNNNQFRGAVPQEYVASAAKGSTTTLYLQHNYLTGFPVKSGEVFPDTVSLCLTYNCLRLPPPEVGVRACPSSAGEQLSRPAYQCSAFNNS